MRLVIGGNAQGKLDYVLSNYNTGEDMVRDGVLPDNVKCENGTVVINHFHHWVKKRIADGACPEDEIMSFLDDCGDCIIISDEIGNGIVPADAFEREYRERAGRLLVKIADRAEEVVRIICGIGQRIK